MKKRKKANEVSKKSGKTLFEVYVVKYKCVGKEPKEKPVFVKVGEFADPQYAELFVQQLSGATFIRQRDTAI